MGRLSCTHLLTLSSFTRRDILEVLNLAEELKQKQKAGVRHELLPGKVIALLFEKPSTRTRVSFEVGIRQLGGHSLYLTPRELQLSRGETLADTARVLSRYVDALVARVYRHETLEELARYATIPVINALSDRYHPCQAIADVFTIKEVKGGFKGVKVAYVGDGNNVCNSLLIACSLVGLDIWVACPKGYEPLEEAVKVALKNARESGSTVKITHSPVEAVKDADVIYTDVWVSMGQEEEREKRLKVFPPYQVNRKLVSYAKGDYVFMHCLPAHRGEEVTDEIIDDEKHSIVWEQAENRLHTQKALLVLLLGS